MAGGITVTHPDTIIYTGNVNRIVIVDGNGVQHDVRQVYWCPDGIEAKLVWPALSKTLVAGTQFVSFEFIPTEDITLDHIGIFTSDAYTGTTVNFAIYHESGLVVAKTNADTAQSTEEKYSLTGQRRIVAVNGILKRGLKYYIQYTDQNGNTIHPAYFQNSQSSETGETGKYKVFTHGQVQNKYVADLSSTHDYKGIITNYFSLFDFAQGDFFIWGGDSTLNSNYCYIRSSLGTTEGYVFKGAIGTSSSDYTNYTDADLQQILNWSTSSEFIWWRGDANLSKTITHGYVYVKTTDTSNIVNVALPAHVDWKSDSNNMCYLLNALKQNSSVIVIENKTYSITVGTICSMKTGYTIDESFDPANPLQEKPSSPTANHIYCVYEQWNNYNEAWLYTTDGTTDTWTRINGESYKDVMSCADFASLLTEVGSGSDFISSSYSTDYISEGLRSASVEQDTKKFYLEINGVEK